MSSKQEGQVDIQNNSETEEKQEQLINEPKEQEIKKEAEHKEGEPDVDKANPYFSLDEERQKYFLLKDGSVLIASNFSTIFQPRKTEHHYCTHYFSVDQEYYYYCKSCKSNKRGYSMCYCQACWIPELHIGHTFKKEKNNCEGAYCDCGRTLRLPQQSFCSSHGPKKSVVLDSPITQEEKTTFINFFTPFFQVFLHQHYKSEKQHDFEKTFQPVLTQLNRLIEGSTFYSLLTMEILKISSNFSHHSEEIDGNIFYDLLGILEEEEASTHIMQFLNHTMNNFESMLEIGRMLGKLNMQNKQVSAQLEELFENFDNLQVNLSLMKEGVILDWNKDKFLEWSWEHAEAFQLVKYCLEERIEKIKSNEYNQYVRDSKCLEQILAVQDSKLNTQHCEYYIKRIFYFFPKTEIIFPLFYSENQKKQEYHQSKKNQPFFNQLYMHNYQSEVAKILQLLGRACQYDMSKINDFRITLGNDLHTLNGLQAFLLVSVRYFEFILKFLQSKNQSNRAAIFLVFIGLSNSSSIKEQLLQQIHLLFKPTTEDSLDQKYRKLQNLYRMVCYLVHHKRIIMKAKMNCRITDRFQGYKSLVSDEQEEKMLENLFKEYLYWRGTLTKPLLYHLRNQGLLEFKNASNVLNHLCTYCKEEECFKYTSEQKYVYPETNFHTPFADISITNSVCSKNKLNIKDEFDFFPQVKTFAANFFNFFALELGSFVALSAERENQNHEFVVILLYIMADKFTDGKNQQIKSCICEMNENSQKWPIFKEESPFRLAALKALCLNNTGQKIRQQVEEERDNIQLVQLRIKAQKRKENIIQTYKKKRTKILSKFGSTNESIESKEENEEICSICHQERQKNNPLVYFAQVLMNSFLSVLTHRKQNKANLLIDTCFHTIHLECFIKSKKRKGILLSCPICNKISNCILPTSYEPEDKKLKNTIQIALVASLIALYKFYETGSFFSILFRHLVHSYGLHSLISPFSHEIKKNTQEKNSLFIQKLMIKIYMTANQEEKVLFDKQCQDFFEQLEECEHRECYLIQYLLAKAILTKLKLQQFDEKEHIIELASLLPANQFVLINRNIQKLTQQQIFVAATDVKTQQNLKRSSLSFSIVRPPETTQEIINIIEGQCSECQTKYVNAFQCLICGATMCKECGQTDNHHFKHNGIKFYLALKEGILFYRAKGQKGQICVYENNFRTLYSERESAYTNKIGKTDVYHLNESDLSELVQKFMSIID